MTGTFAPDDEANARSLRRAGIDRLAAVLVAHSHYDHALDAAVVARADRRRAREVAVQGDDQRWYRPAGTIASNRHAG